MKNFATLEEGVVKFPKVAKFQPNLARVRIFPHVSINIFLYYGSI